MIDFKTIPEQTIPRMKGGEGYAKARAYEDERVKILRSTLEKGCSIGLHTHATGDEIVYVLSGEGASYLDGKEEILKAGMVHYCSQGHSHSMKNTGEAPLECLCVVHKQ
jgi:quercetin dioxygenase-like cupin family protein